MDREHEQHDRMPEGWKRVSSLSILDNVTIDKFSDFNDTAPARSFGDVGILGAQIGDSLQIMKGYTVTPTSAIEAIAEDEQGRKWVQTRNSFYRITLTSGTVSMEMHPDIAQKKQKAVSEPSQRTAWNLWGLLGKKS